LDPENVVSESNKENNIKTICNHQVEAMGLESVIIEFLQYTAGAQLGFSLSLC